MRTRSRSRSLSRSLTRSLSRSLVSAALLTGALAAAGLTTATPASAASSPNAWPAHVFAPYFDAGSGNVSLTDVANNYGTKFFTAAFVDGPGCQWQVPGQSALQSQIDGIRGLGGDVSVSFGGYTSDTALTEIGDSCSSPEAAAAQIENVITTFNLSHVDFDIESASLTNSSGIDRRDKALAQVRTWAANNGRALSISVTLPALPSGLSGDGVNVLNNARSNGFTPDVVNLMTMDYGSSGTDMGNAANTSVDAAASQVASAFGISTSAAYAKLGNTPMIGQNDSAGEVFTLDNARSVEAFDASRGIALTSYWSQNRDNGGCAGSTSAQSTCSGVSQNSGDFARIFQAFTSGSSSGGGATGSTVQSLPGTWAQCASENGTCGVSGTTAVAYGASGRFNYATETGSTPCTNAVFGDPISGTAKSCYGQTAPPATNVWTSCAAEGGTCAFSGVMTVAYGAGSSFNYATLPGGTACSNAVFGDPAANTVKSCYLIGAPPSFATWTNCAAEDGTCTFSGTHEVAYGAAGRYVYRSVSGSTGCSNGVFGDPVSGTAKSCYVQ
ncbi:chitinase [Streptomyces sp. NRRL F-525]|uniref:chitinase n=1 Tax=Streptomyces sp. NRRL F-525 TaxID=1463861 RepID=UPI00068B3FFE|nr:chitinase [Streptomyces sp. NRRL F-525]